MTFPDDDDDRGFGDDEVTQGETQLIDLENNTLNLDLQKAKEKDAVLIIIRGNPQGKKFTLSKTRELHIIGRDKSAEIRVNDANISRQHAQIRKAEGGYLIEDLGSRNGTFLNDQKLQFATGLNKEDMIKVGTTILKYIPAGEIEILYQDNLTNAAYYDELTQVFNRNYITQAFDAEFKRAKALHTSFPVILFDVDHFKRVNDTYGHAAGDYVLRELTNVIKASGLRERDILGRWGGEEFLMLVTNSTMSTAEEMSERIRRVVEQHRFQFEGQHIPITISLGVANIKRSHADMMDLYKDADQALYAAKKGGRNRVAIFDHL